MTFTGGVWYPFHSSSQCNFNEVSTRVREDAVVIDVLIPALNEEQSLPHVLDALQQQDAIPVRRCVVVDNGSTDRTPLLAREHGAHVIQEPTRGYGKACLTGLAYMQTDPPDIVVFLDGDFSDYPEEVERIIAPILLAQVDMVIGSRTIGQREQGALLPQALFGNALATFLIEFMHHYNFTDLGPFRAITWDALTKLKMEDQNYGWTVEMQIKAAFHNLSCVEVPVSYRKRIGQSKVSGTVKGSVLAGYKILKTIFMYSFSHRSPS